MPLIKYLPPSLKEWLQHRAGGVTLHGRLQNLQQAGFNPRKIIDAGAFHGEWAKTASALFPKARLLLIEPQPDLQVSLGKLCQKFPNLQLYQALLGAEQKRTTFLLQHSNSRVVPSGYVPLPGEQLIEVQIERLETIIRKTGFENCDLLKLDLQGYELEALEGAGELFGRAEVIFIEVSWIRIGPVPIAAEVIERFTKQGYRLYDVLGFNYRPLDRALWQTDFIFVKDTSPLLSSQAWI